MAEDDPRPRQFRAYNPAPRQAYPRVRFDAPSWWPSKLPDAILDYTLDIGAAIDPAVDFIVSATAAVAPSGAGEMQPSNLRVAGACLTLTMTGGQPGRTYTVKFIVPMTDNRIFEFLVRQYVPPLLPEDLPQAIPDPGFGPPATWSFGPSLDFSQPRNSALRLWGWN